MTFVSFLFFTGLVATLTWWLTRGDDHASTTGYFLAGRSLTFPLIAGSLLLTNLSTEQMVGLNGAAFTDGLCVMVWEVVCIIALVFMAWFFLPRFLKSGVATVPEYLELRFDRGTATITNLIFLVSYIVILLPLVLYTGATALMDLFGVETLLAGWTDLTGEDLTRASLYLLAGLLGAAGAAYALFGGLRTVAVSDTINGVGLLVGGLMIAAFGLAALGDGGGMTDGLNRLWDEQRDRFNSVGSRTSSVPFSAIFSGIFLLNLFYWTTNQQIIQRTLGASSLAEGQKGVLLTGALKLLGPLYLVIPGMIAFSLFAGRDLEANRAYGTLVQEVLPAPLRGFFAAAIVGAILSSFNSGLNSTCTLFSLGVYRRMLRPNAGDRETVLSGRVFGIVVTIASVAVAPLLNSQKEIFDYLQKMNGLYFIPIFAVVLVGMLNRRVPARAAKLALVAGPAVIATGYFAPGASDVVASMHDFHFTGVVFAWLVILMIVIGEVSPRDTEYVQPDVGAVDMTPWRLARPAGYVLIVTVVAIYALFADFSVLTPFGES